MNSKKNPPATKPKKSLSKKAKHLKRSIEELNSPAKPKMRAIAIKYKPGKDRAPKVVASGRGAVAEKILKLAEDHKIPMYEDTSLTELLSKLNIETEIPAELYALVAEVLAFVYQLDKMAKKKKRTRK